MFVRLLLEAQPVHLLNQNLLRTIQHAIFHVAVG